MFARLLNVQLAQESERLRESERIKVPQVEKLTINYRTHNGILGCAARLVDVILDLFPNAVDKLEKDRGHFNGPKPALLTETSTDHLAILLVGSDRTQSQIEFGAHQAVLVRSQAAKETLPEEFDGALVLTIFEAKGLEFDDVFIYNFFTDSPADEKAWRVLTGWWEQQHATEDGVTSKSAASLAIPAPRSVPFSKERHGILEEELKQLYTAVTRARVRVAMYDASTDKRQPVFSLLHAEGLAEIEEAAQRGDSSRKGWAVAATKEEWQSRARNLLDNKLYKLAVRCFTSAEDRLGMLTALGYQLFEESTKLPTGVAQRDRLLRAAGAFDEAGELKTAAACLAAAGEFTLAAVAREKLGQTEAAAKVLVKGAEARRRQGQPADATSLLAEAATVYERAGRLRDALSVRLTHKELHGRALESLEVLDADHPERVPMLQLAFAHLKRVKSWPSCLKVNALLRSAGVWVEATDVDKIAQTAAYAHRKKGEKKAMLEAVRQFSKPKAQIDFLEEVGESASAIGLMLELGQQKEALDLMLASRDDRAAETARAVGDGTAELLADIVTAQTRRDASTLPALLERLNGRDDSLLRLFALDVMRDLRSQAWSTSEIRPEDLTYLTRCILTCRMVLDSTTAAASTGLLQQCVRCLRPNARGQLDMPMWKWLAEAAGHDSTKPLLIQQDEFMRMFGAAVHVLASRWLRHERAIFAAGKRAISNWAPIRDTVRDPRWCSTWFNHVVQQLDFCAQARKLSAPRSKLDKAPQSLLSVIPSQHFLFSLVEQLVALAYPGYLEKADVTFDVAPDVKDEIKRYLVRQASNVLPWLHRWWLDLSTSTKHWKMPLVALLYKVYFELLAPGNIPGLNHGKYFFDRVEHLNIDALRDHRFQRELFPRSFVPFAAQRTAKDRAGRSPGQLLLYSALILNNGNQRIGNLTNGLRYYVDYLDMTAQSLQHARRASTSHLTPCMSMCMDLIERIVASALVVFAQRTQQRLMLPETIAQNAFSSAIDFAEARTMPEKEVNYLHARLRSGLTAIRNLGLMELADGQSPHVMDRAALLCLAVLGANHVAQLSGYNNLLVAPLQNVHKHTERSDLAKAVSAWLPNSRFYAYEEDNVPLRLQRILKLRYDNLVVVRLEPAAQRGSLRAKWTERLDAEDLVKWVVPKDPPPVLGSRHPQSAAGSNHPAANKFGALDIEETDDSAAEPEASNEAFEADLMQQQRLDAAATALQAHARAAFGRKRARQREAEMVAAQTVKQQLTPSARDLGNLGEQYGPSAALDSYSDRMREFEAERMQVQGRCLWCGEAWESGHGNLANRVHFSNRENFLNVYYQFSMQQCAPLLLELDALQLSTRNLRSDSLTEEAAQQAFELRDAIESSQSSLVAALDYTEKKRDWTAPHNQHHMLTTTTADVRASVQKGRDLIAELTASSGVVPSADVVTEAAEALVEEPNEEDDDDNELGHLHSDVKRGQPRRRGGGGKGKRGGKGKKKATRDSA